MTIDQAITKLQKLSKLTSSQEACEMGIAALRAQQEAEQAIGVWERFAEFLASDPRSRWMQTFGSGTVTTSAERDVTTRRSASAK